MFYLLSAVIVGCLASMAVSCGKEDIRDQMNPLDVEGPEGTLEINDWAMMTKEEVAQVSAYCDENKISYKQRLTELGD